MECKTVNIKSTCGIKTPSVCVTYEDFLPEWSSLSTITNISDTTNEIYKQLDEIKNYININPTNSSVKTVNNTQPDNLGNIYITTSNITEGTNRYFTEGRSRASISSTVEGLTYSQNTGILSLNSGRIIPLESSLSKVFSVNGQIGDVIISSEIFWKKDNW